MAARRVVLAAVLTAVALLAHPVAASAAGGIDGDGTADVLARGADGRLWLYAGDGSSPPANPWLTTPPRVVGTGWSFADRMVFGDVSGDGRQDVLAREGTLADGTLWIYPHDGTATPWTSRIWAGFGWNIAIVIMAGDVTGDGRTDIVTRESDGRMWLYPHSGDLTMPYPTRRVIGANWQQTTAMLLADVTGDGRLDVVARHRDGVLWVYPQQDARAALYFDFRPTRRLAVAPYPAGGGWTSFDQLTATDVTGDGRPDMVARGGGTLRVYPHSGAAPGTNPWPTAYPAGDWWAQYPTVLAA